MLQVTKSTNRPARENVTRNKLSVNPRRKGTAIKRDLNRAPRIVGIVAAAQKLGVSRMHLWSVLRGDRKSARLLERYVLLQHGRKAE